MSLRARAAGLAVGYVADMTLGDPRRGHPVAAFGRAARWSERLLHADARMPGIAHTTLLVGGATALGAGVRRAARSTPVAETLVVGVATWVSLGGRSLVREGEAMSVLLDHDDVATARARLSHLCSRDATSLDTDNLARATVESLAENTSDAVVAPLVWGAVAGPAGLLGYRAANTLDAMVGYRSDRYRNFGWASARLDDVLNLGPARLAASLTTALAPVVGGSAGRAWTVWRRDAHLHPSPNAGPVEAAFAGALGVRLSGAHTQAGTTEDRGSMDGGRPVATGDIPRAATLSQVVGAGALLVCLAGLHVADRLARRGAHS